MTDVSFGSTYRIPLVEQGITKAKREQLKNMVKVYQNFAYPKGNNGYVRVSMGEELDAGFEQKLKQIGFKVFQKFAAHNVSATDGSMDSYIKEQLDSRNYKSVGKQMKKARKYD